MLVSQRVYQWISMIINGYQWISMDIEVPDEYGKAGMGHHHLHRRPVRRHGRLRGFAPHRGSRGMFECLKLKPT